MKLQYKLKNDINEITSALVGRSVIEDQNYPYVKECGGDSCKIGFAGDQMVGLGLSSASYETIYNGFVGGRAFNFMMLDGGIVQMSYIVQGGEVSAHRLAYYPNPRIGSFQEHPDEYDRDDYLTEINERRNVLTLVRFDFDASERSFKPVLHPRSHLTLGQYSRCRIPVSAPLSPVSFVRFLLRHFYSNGSTDFAQILPHGSTYDFDRTLDPVEAREIHVEVPKIRPIDTSSPVPCHS